MFHVTGRTAMADASVKCFAKVMELAACGATKDLPSPQLWQGWMKDEDDLSKLRL
jgi:hypothetical protein